jgi:hypothetical protein
MYKFLLISILTEDLHFSLYGLMVNIAIRLDRTRRQPLITIQKYMLN